METSCTFASTPEKESPPFAKLLLPLGLLALSTAAILIKVCEAPPLVIAAYRLTISALVLILLTLPRLRRDLAKLAKQEIVAAILAGGFLCFHFAFWMTSLRYTSVASSVILVTTNPIFVALASLFLLRERVSPLLFLAILIAVSGGMIIGWGDWDKGRESLYGDFLALLGALMATGYLLTGRRIRQKTDLRVYITLAYGAAALFLVLLAVLSGDPLFGYPPKTYFLFFLLALGPQLIGHTVINWALRFFSAALVAVLILGEPIGATILATLLLGEPLGPWVITGGGLVLLGIYLAAREERRIHEPAR